MSTAPHALVARVSRRELALNRYVWLATGSMFALLTLAVALSSLLPLAANDLYLQLFAGVLGLVAFVLLRSEPPPIGSPYNHLVLACIYLGTTGGILAYSPGGSAAIGATMFVGPLTAVRLLDRREIVAHFVLATVCLSIPAVLGIVDRPTVLAALTVVPAMWVLGACCVIVLEAAEAQGEELEGLVRRDPLTGVGNRRLLSERLSEEITRHGRVQRPLSLLALDLNGFKALNDTVGHAAGDDVLRDVAAALERVARPHDIVVRQGGDEFCIILPGTSATEAERCAEAVRSALAGIDTHGVTISTGMGIASFPKDAVHGGVLLHVADERLRASKEAVAAPSAAPTPTNPVMSVYRGGLST